MNKKTIIISLFLILYLLFIIVSPALAGLEECKNACDISKCKGERGFMGAVSEQCHCCGCCELIDFLKMARRFAEGLAQIVGVWALIFFIVGGIMWMLSGGNPEMVKRGKQILISSLIGIFIVFLAWHMVNLVICGLSKGEISGSCKIFEGTIFERKWSIFPESTTTPSSEQEVPCEEPVDTCALINTLNGKNWEPECKSMEVEKVEEELISIGCKLKLNKADDCFDYDASDSLQCFQFHVNDTIEDTGLPDNLKLNEDGILDKKTYQMLIEHNPINTRCYDLEKCK